jgi:hypothetical protein
MPLSEISNNVRRSSSNVRDKAGSEAGSVSTPNLPPRAVQSMLKTSTELGDLGQFAIKPSRLPRSGSRLQSTRPRSGSFDTSFVSALRHERSSQARRHGRHDHHRHHHGPRPTGSSSGFSARNISQSNLSSYTNVSRRRRYPPGPHPYPLQGLTSPGPSHRGLHHHRSLITLRSHASLAPPSPMMPGGPMGRPPYRASSPAYSDMRSMSHTPRPGFMRAPSVGTLGSSPGSLFPRHRGPPGYRPDFNASYTSLGRMPSPAISFHGPNPYPHHGPIRTPTPSSAFVHPQHPMLSHNSLAALPRSPTGSTIPQYYDYSESFVEESCFSPDAAPDPNQPPLTMDHTILNGVNSPPREAQTPFGTRAGSAFLPVELPTSHNRRPSEQSKPSFNGVIPKRYSSLGAPALQKSSPEMVRQLVNCDPMLMSTVAYPPDSKRRQQHQREGKGWSRYETSLSDLQAISNTIKL